MKTEEKRIVLRVAWLLRQCDALAAQLHQSREELLASEERNYLMMIRSNLFLIPCLLVAFPVMSLSAANPPAFVTATPESCLSIGLSWPSAGGSGGNTPSQYQIFRDSSNTQIATVPATVFAFLDSAAGAYSTHTYGVRTIAANGSFSTVTWSSSVSTAPLCGPVVIVQQPQSTVVAVGDAVTFTVTGAGTAPLYYQWRKEGLPISGATDSFLTLTNVSFSDVGNYDVVLTNAFGTVTSSNAYLLVLPPNAPAIFVNGLAQNGTVTVGTSASITIAGGFVGGFVFYTRDGTAPSPSATLYAGPFTVTNDVMLRAMSLSADFTQSSEASAVDVVVLPAFSLAASVVGGGVIAANPLSGPYVSNSVVTLTAAPQSNWAFSHWTGDLIGSANPTQLTMDGPRSVTAVFIPTAVPLTINTPGGGSVTANGQNIAANSYYPTGSVVSLEANASAGWSFLHWQGTTNSLANPFNITMSQTQIVEAIFGTVVSTNISSSGTVTMSEPNPVPFGTQLSLTAIPSAGYYFVTWSGAASGTNNPTFFTVETATPTVGALFALSPKPTILSDPTNLFVILGVSAHFYAAASGAEPLSYQWRKSGLDIPDATNSVLTISNTVAGDAGNYDFVVMNGFEATATSAVATLTILIPVAITNQPIQQVVPYWGSASFSVGAYGFPAPFYQWTFNGAFLTNANSASLVLTNIGTNRIGDYAVVAWNSFSAVTSSIASLWMSPSLRSPFLGTTATWGKPAVLSVGAVGSGELFYQWYKDGALVADGTNATLEFPTVQISDGGLYSVVVTSTYGSVTNVPAQLVVNPANIALGLYAGVTIDGVVGYTYGIQYSTDLTDTNSWVTLTNLTLTEPVQIWVDTSVDVHAPGNPKRYYRVMVP